MMSAGKQDLSGRWSGIFSYPRLLPPTPFDADLRDHLGALLGETFEYGAGRRTKGRPMHGMIEGQRSGDVVSFVKTYDDLGRLHTPVYYSGRLNADGTEISGTWEIPGHWSGNFLMMRAKADSVVMERELAQPVT